LFLPIHHFTKGNASRKKPIDRMSGSGVFARDADTIITLTEHVEDGCYTLETTLRNFPPQAPFVVEWQFPLMVERPDLDPADFKGSEVEEEDELTGFHPAGHDRSHLSCNPSTTFPNSSPELGFATNSSAPSSFALVRSSSRVDDVNTTTGVRL
jgi:hypothetical protein